MSLFDAHKSSKLKIVIFEIRRDKNFRIEEAWKLGSLESKKGGLLEFWNHSLGMS